MEKIERFHLPCALSLEMVSVCLTVCKAKPIIGISLRITSPEMAFKPSIPCPERNRFAQHYPVLQQQLRGSDLVAFVKKIRSFLYLADSCHFLVQTSCMCLSLATRPNPKISLRFTILYYNKRLLTKCQQDERSYTFL